MKNHGETSAISLLTSDTTGLVWTQRDETQAHTIVDPTPLCQVHGDVVKNRNSLYKVEVTKDGGEAVLSVCSKCLIAGIVLVWCAGTHQVVAGPLPTGTSTPPRRKLIFFLGALAGAAGSILAPLLF